jgi:hypothetical protein
MLHIEIGLNLEKATRFISLGIKARKDEFVAPPTFPILLHILYHSYQIMFYNLPTFFVEVCCEPIWTWGLVRIKLGEG